VRQRDHRIRHDEAGRPVWASESTDRASAKQETARQPTSSPDHPANPETLLALQRLAGNAAVTQCLARKAADDEEADSAGDASAVHDVVGRGGQPLDDHVRDGMEGVLGVDLGPVRVHDDPAASSSAQAVHARAYTVGNDVVFQSGEYRPETTDGMRTLAHELTHVAQQRHGPVDGTDIGGGVAVSDPSDRFEQAAEANAERVMQEGNLKAQRPSADQGASGPAEAVLAGVAQRAGTSEDDQIADTPVQRSVVQRDSDDMDTPSSPSVEPGSTGDGGVPSVEEFLAQFDVDQVVDQMASLRSDEGDSAASLESPQDASSGLATAQGLFVQRDPPPGTPSGSPPASSAPAPQPDSSGGGTTQPKPGGAGDVVAAVSKLPEVKTAVDQAKAKVAADWKAIMAGTTTPEKVALFTVSGTIAAGALTGVMSNPSSRTAAVNAANGVKVEIPGFSGVSVSLQTGNGEVRGGMVTVDVLKLVPGLKKAF
jgi:hypothetical protein